MMAVPDKRYTFDHPRPVTPLDHLARDFETGGEPTRVDGCLDHVKCLHPQWKDPIPEEEQYATALNLAKRTRKEAFDTHYHTWTTESLLLMLRWIETNFLASLLHTRLVFSENIFALKKQ
jgi:hypothetical protein